MPDAEGNSDFFYIVHFYCVVPNMLEDTGEYARLIRRFQIQKVSTLPQQT